MKDEKEDRNGKWPFLTVSRFGQWNKKANTAPSSGVISRVFILLNESVQKYANKDLRMELSLAANARR